MLQTMEMCFFVCIENVQLYIRNSLKNLYFLWSNAILDCLDERKKKLFSFIFFLTVQIETSWSNKETIFLQNCFSKKFLWLISLYFIRRVIDDLFTLVENANNQVSNQK